MRESLLMATGILVEFCLQISLPAYFAQSCSQNVLNTIPTKEVTVVNIDNVFFRICFL